MSIIMTGKKYDLYNHFWQFIAVGTSGLKFHSDLTDIQGIIFYQR